MPAIEVWYPTYLALRNAGCNPFSDVASTAFLANTFGCSLTAAGTPLIPQQNGSNSAAAHKPGISSAGNDQDPRNAAHPAAIAAHRPRAPSAAPAAGHGVIPSSVTIPEQKNGDEEQIKHVLRVASRAHVAFSRKQHNNDLSEDEVVALLEYQLKAGKPLLAPWYRQ